MRIQVNCSHCATTFSKRSDHLHAKNYCGRQCQGAARRVLEPKWPRKGERQTEASKAYLAAYVQANKEKHNERGRAWARKNAEKRAEVAANWRANNRSAVAAHSQKRRAAGALTAFECAELYARSAGRCVYCGLKTENIHLDHVQPIAKGGLSKVGNIIPACRGCNLRKAAKEPDAWLYEAHGTIGLARAILFLEGRDHRVLSKMGGARK